MRRRFRTRGPEAAQRPQHEVAEARNPSIMALLARFDKRPSNLTASVVGCFLRPGQRVLVTATLSQVSVWTSDDADFETAPLVLLGAAHTPTFATAIGFCCIPKLGTEGAAGGRVDLLLVLMLDGRWSVLQIELDKESTAISFRPALLCLDNSAEASPAHGALRLEPGVSRHRHPAGALMTQRNGPAAGEHFVLVAAWASTIHLLIFRSAGGTGNGGGAGSLEVRAVVEDVDSLALGLHGVSPQRQILAMQLLEAPNDLDFEGYPLLALQLVDTAHLVQVDTVGIEVLRSHAATPQAPGVFRLQQGPWGIDNAHPTTSLILPLPPTLGGGLLTFSFAAIMAVGDQGVRGKIETCLVFTSAVAIGDVNAEGPAGNKGASCHAFILGAANGWVFRLLVSASNRSPDVVLSLQRLSLLQSGEEGGDCCLSAPSSLVCYTQGQRTLIVWCGVTGHTSLLSLSPTSSWDLASVSVGALECNQGEGGWGEGIRGVVSLLPSTFEPNLGHVRQAIAICRESDPQTHSEAIPGARLAFASSAPNVGPSLAHERLDSEIHLVLACGRGSDSLLRLCCSGVAIDVHVEGPEMLDCLGICTLRAPSPAGEGKGEGGGLLFDTHVIFSFGGSDGADGAYTQVLELKGTEFVPIAFAGWRNDAATLAALATPLGHSIQVTPFEILARPLVSGATGEDEGAYPASARGERPEETNAGKALVRLKAKAGWHPRVGQMTMASAALLQRSLRASSTIAQEVCGMVVVAVDCVVHLLQVVEDASTAGLRWQASRQFSHQISALNLWCVCGCICVRKVAGLHRGKELLGHNW